jgi:site-specific DNA-methyltransferase (cytosine-N4-specific)
MYCGKSDELLEQYPLTLRRGKVQLIFTSPPFVLNRKKKYGNLQGQEYVDWLASFARLCREYVRPGGSIVIELGNAWESGRPTMTTLAVKALIEFQEAADLHLCQEFIWFNPARLPSPAQWVNVERVRVKDAFTRLWWMSPSPRPKADNRRVLCGYSASMQALLRRKKYNAGPRPSEHHIGGRSFLKDNGGAIPANVLQFSNTKSRCPYHQYCQKHDLRLHPARMPVELASFFIRFLTEESDLVLDPFAGSNTTGAVAEGLKRRWISIEAEREYVEGSRGRFTSP